MFKFTSHRSEIRFPLETSGIDNIIFGVGRRKEKKGSNFVVVFVF